MKKIILTIVMFLSFIPAAFPQSKVGTTIGQFLKIEPSSRVAALGNAGAALYGEASMAYFNPASLGRLQNLDLQFTYNQWIADIDYNYAIAAMNFDGLGTFTLQVTSLNSGEIDVRTVEQPGGTGEQYTVSDFALGLGYGLMLTDRVSVGVLVNYVNESIWHSSLNAFGLNFGVQYQVYENGPIIGASVSNFGPSAKYDGRDLYLNYDFDPKKYGDNDQIPAELRMDEFSLPTVFRAGVSVPFNFGEDYKFLVAAEAIHPNDNNESVNVGMEVNFFNNFFVRGGYRSLFLKDSEGGLMLGGGVNVNVLNSYKIRFDYAWADYGRLEQAHRITASLNL